MNRITGLFIIAILALIAAVSIGDNARYNDLLSRNRDIETRAEIERQQQAEKKKKKKKELRLIKTDIDIMQNGSKK